VTQEARDALAALRTARVDTHVHRGLIGETDLTDMVKAMELSEAIAKDLSGKKVSAASAKQADALNVCLKVLVIASKDSWEDALEWECEQSEVALGYDDLLPDDYKSPKTKGKKCRRKSKSKSGKKAAGADLDLSSSESSDSSDDSVLRKTKSQHKPSAKAKNFAKGTKKKKKTAAQRPAKAVRKAKTKLQTQKKKKTKAKQAKKGKAAQKVVRDPKSGEKIKCFT
jgi:hypothetical protein